MYTSLIHYRHELVVYLIPQKIKPISLRRPWSDIVSGGLTNRCSNSVRNAHSRLFPYRTEEGNNLSYHDLLFIKYLSFLIPREREREREREHFLKKATDIWFFDFYQRLRLNSIPWQLLCLVSDPLVWTHGVTPQPKPGGGEEEWVVGTAGAPWTPGQAPPAARGPEEGRHRRLERGPRPAPGTSGAILGWTCLDQTFSIPFLYSGEGGNSSDPTCVQ